MAMLINGCIGTSNSEVMRLVEERDSLRQVSKEQYETLNSYGNTIATLNETLDSIAYQENMLFVNVGEIPITKEDVKHNLMRFEALLKKQSKKISQLESQLAESKDANEQSLGLIAHFNEQLAAKNRQILQLKKELENKNVDIARLQEQVASQNLTITTQTATISELNQRTKRQGEALARQDAILNNGYVLIGSKDDLSRKGILKKGKIVADAALDRSKFAQIDIREWREVTFTAKRPRILTNMPASSYEITTTGNHSFTLIVKNPSDFWRISTYLVIQTN
jgi:chromosome segregation ATPase